ncbi:MAG: mitofusin [Heterodermia speciosa]|uniref:Mitofusin n=1 Tax=Heterodermia speciosa TaxID=116794 RepID=A0A8H3I8F5_9LECA|nr:MAG: mitofusin [Heterodermia speciosa]
MSSSDRSKSSSASGSSPFRPSSQASSSHNAPRPQYMTVGSGSTSASAAALMASLDRDSGYGASISGGEYPHPGDSLGWNAREAVDRPIPNHTPTISGEYSPAAENERRVLASHIHQLAFNQNRVKLGRAINKTVDTLEGLKVTNSSWPAQYPAVNSNEPRAPKQDPRPGIVHTQSTRTLGDGNSEHDAPLRPGVRRAGTSIGESSTGESSTATPKAAQEPTRLITPQAAQEFSILKLDLRVQGLTQAEIAHSTDKRTIASLLDGKLNQCIRHLQQLKDRIEDTSSKVLVTGDLNAGKSTFCNALLRRKVLPEDQQPCTSIFCEVLDARENGGVEEAHAVHKDTIYNRNDESTYDVYPLHELEKVVTDNKDYTQCKVYVKDIRSVNESLLNNGIVDISIIDAPGLNSDSLKTTAVFARQEEIDVVVFVVNAANHFTLSAKEFIWNAAMEKAYLFIVVNGFDNIRDKERCQRMILEQVATLSPRTFKESSELVHFVSSNAIPVAPAGGPGFPGGDGGGGGSGSSSDPDNVPSFDDGETLGKHGEPGSPPGKGKGKDKEKLQDFQELEGALRRFVLEKRARSKLAPAKTYLLNVLSDLNVLATVNREVAQSELTRVISELQELEPAYEQSKKARTEASDDVDKTIEDTCNEIYSHTRSTLNSTIIRVAEADLGVPYPGILNAFQYADDIKAAMLDQISAAVTTCEEDARSRTVNGVNTIKSLGILHLGNQYSDLGFRSDKMFRSKRDVLARQVDTEIEVWDFFDVAGLWERQEKVAGTSVALTVAGVLGGRMVGGVGWIDGAMGAARVMGAQNLRRMIVPSIVASILLASAYVLYSIPTTLRPRLASKLRTTLDQIEYTHTNSLRISSEVRKILRFPAENLRAGLEKSVVQLAQQRAETLKVKSESEVARKYFGNLVRESAEGRRSVEDVDLEGGPQVPGGYGGDEGVV